MMEKSEISEVFEKAVDYLKMHKKISPTRFALVRDKIAQVLQRGGFGEFTDDEVETILDKVDKD